MVNRKQLVSACGHLFRRSGGTTGCSGLFAELRSDLRAIIQTGARIGDGELPIVASVVDDRHWLVATTDRVIFRAGGEVTSLPLNQVEEAHSLALEDGSVEGENVLVLIAHGQRYEVQIEAGYPMGGIWNVIRRLVRTWKAESTGIA